MGNQLGFTGITWSDENLPTLPKRTVSLVRRETENYQLELDLRLPSEDEFTAMTDDEITLIREDLVSRALRAAVDGRVSHKQRTEWVEWISSDEIHPFSFVVSALESGVDPVALREVFESFVKRHHKKFANELEVALHH